MLVIDDTVTVLCHYHDLLLVYVHVVLIKEYHGNPC